MPGEEQNPEECPSFAQNKLVTDDDPSASLRTALPVVK